MGNSLLAFTIGFVSTALLVFFGFALERAGVFKWVDSKINAIEEEVKALPLPFNPHELKADVERIKVLLNFREFKK